MLSWSLACIFTCFVDNLFTSVFALMITCSLVYLLWWSHAPMFTCFDVWMLLCSHVSMIVCYYIYMLWWSHAHLLVCLRTLLHLDALMITCPYVQILWWLPAHMHWYLHVWYPQTCAHTLMMKCLLARRLKWKCSRMFVRLNALMIVLECWGD